MNCVILFWMVKCVMLLLFYVLYVVVVFLVFMVTYCALELVCFGGLPRGVKFGGGDDLVCEV